MFVKQLDHLNLEVDNLDQSIDWYGRVFGFQVVESGRTHRRFAILRAGDAMLCLYQGKTEKGSGLNHFAFRITDRHAWEEKMRSLNISVSYGDGEIRYPHSSSWYVKDPSGYEIEVVAWDNDEVRF